MTHESAPAAWLRELVWLLPAYVAGTLAWAALASEPLDLASVLSSMVVGLYMPVLYLGPASIYVLLIAALSKGRSLRAARTGALALLPILPLSLMLSLVLLAAPAQGLTLPMISDETVSSLVGYGVVMPVAFALLVGLDMRRFMRR